MRKRKTLKRVRVNRMLESIFFYPMTILEAPMGYGKTTAVREFLAARASPVLWISFLSSENNTSFFWDKLVKEIGKLDEIAGARLKSLGFPSDTPQIDTVLSVLCELDYEENTTLVIDDFYLVKGPQIGMLLNKIVIEEPDNLHIVVVTRDTSNLNIMELSAKCMCNILPQHILCFTDSEMQDYCSLMGFKPTASVLKEICQYTGGWISLTYLILLGLEQGIPIGRNSVINELVDQVLYSALNEQIQQFLLQLSVMDSFTVKQAQFVTQKSKAEEFLKKLRRENAFITFDESTGIYSIHNVLLDFLRLKQGGGQERNALYRRLGEWHFENKEYIPAYTCLYRSGETERVLSLLDNEETITNKSTEFEGALDMFASAPRTLLFKYPLAYLQYLIMLLLCGDPCAVREGTSRLDELQTVYETMKNLHLSRKNRILAEINTVRIFSVFNDEQKMVCCTTEALRLLEGGISCLMKQESEFTFGSPHFLYSYYKEPGKLKKTVDFMVAEFPTFSQLSNGCGTGSDMITLAEYALETGNWQAAEHNAFKAIYKARTKNQTSIVICASFTLLRLYLFQGRVDDRLELMRQLKSDVARENNPVYNTTLELIDGYINGCIMRLDAISEWLQIGDMSPASFMYQGMAFNYIVFGKAVMLTRNFIQLEVLTEEFAGYFSIFKNQLGFLHNQIFDAITRYQLYGLEQGIISLKKALAMAREDGIILPFAEYAPHILDMLAHIAPSTDRDPYINQVLLSCRQYMESLKHTPQSAASISERELEVLLLTAEGLKRIEIAKRLGISDGTVKTHLGNIYRKLETNGKAATIKKAQKLKLI
jgi:LuxR family maltose regulon positive regulatory protein